jgi:hypothetical protein
VALLPFLVTHLALLLSINAGRVEACIPYLEGCTSISRAARHDLANDLFRYVMLPVALLHLYNWLAARHWLARRHPHSRAGMTLFPLGLTAALALAVYVYALGSEGELYRFMRRFGITFYFAASYLAQLAFVKRLGEIERPARIEQRAMLAIGLMLLGMGVGNVVVGAAIENDALKDRIENILEWNLALLMTFWFLLQARLWRRLA